MTVNIKALVHGLGKTYQQIIEEGLIPYKTEPSATSGELTLHLEMAKEGVFLSFLREGRILKEISLRIQHDKVKNWMFPNELPFGLKKTMNRSQVHAVFGPPLRSSEPKVIMRRALGRADLYSVDSYQQLTSMQIRYDLAEMVASIVFLPTSELRW